MSEQSSVEAKITKLRELVAWFESDEFVLEKATDQFKAAAKLAEEIEQDLKALKNDVEVVKKSFEQA